MGEVYEAEDAKLSRKVALKIMPAQHARDPRRRDRFEREARAVAALNHPNIVTIYSVEESGGTGFITMELVDGQTLRQILPRGGLPLGRLLNLAIPLTEAVAAAHQQGITHRDLKPENILVTREGKVKVLDFGLAKVDEGRNEAGAASRLPTVVLTEEGRIVGTVAYMSPEQGEGKRVDPRSDVFSLGIILYEMSTGERPFKGGSTVSLLSSILKDNPPPVTDINPALPRDLARIVDRCLLKDPARRFQTAMGLATELLTLKRDSESGEIEAVRSSGRRSDAAAAPAAREAGRARTLRYVLAGAGVVAAVALLALLWQWRGSASRDDDVTKSGPADAAAPRRDGRQRIVVLPFENLGASDDAYFAAGVTEEITSRLVAVKELGVISRASAVQYAGTTKSTRQIGDELGVDYVLAGTVRWERCGSGTSRVRVTPQLVRVADDTQLWGDRYDREMKDIFTVQSEIAEQVVDKMGLAMVRPESPANGAQPTQNLDAYQDYLRAKSQSHSAEMTRESNQQVVDLLEQAVRLDPSFALAWAELSQIHTLAHHYRFDFSEERLARARECADKALALQPGLREGHLALGYYYYQGRRDYAQALEQFRIAAGGRENDPDILEAMAYIQRRQGRWDESVAALEKAYSLNPRKLDLVANLCGTYQALRRYPDALRLADVMISLGQNSHWLLLTKAFIQIEADGSTRAARETLKPIDPRTFPELPGVEGLLDLLDGRYQEALEHMALYPRDVLDNQDLYDPKPLLVGMIYLAMGDGPRARAECESARQRLEQDIAKSPRDARMRSALSRALACLGRKDEAVRQARLAADIVPVSSDALDGPKYLVNLAQVHVMVGDTEAAIDLLEKLLAMPAGGSVGILRLDPTWAPLRSIPRFQRLIEKHGQPAA
jgi:TolB-like protein/Flp pilus assembly protein TadD